MDVAGVILGSLSLLLGLVLSAYQLQRFFRFRRPLFKVEEVELPAREQQAGKKAYTFVGPGKVVINARGANRPISIKESQVIFLGGAEKKPLGGYGSSGITANKAGATGILSLPFLVDLPTETWHRFHIDLGQVGIQKEHLGPESTLELELHLRSPEEPFVVPVKLRATQKGDSYFLDDMEEESRWHSRTMFRNRSGIVHGISRRLRRALSAARSLLPHRQRSF